MQHDLFENEGEGVKGRLELFQKFIRFIIIQPYNYHQYLHRHDHHLLHDLYLQPRKEDRRDKPVHLPSPLRHLQPRLLALLLACQGDYRQDDDDHEDNEPDDDHKDDYHEDGIDDDYNYEDNEPDGVDVEDLFTQGSNETYKNEAD